MTETPTQPAPVQVPANTSERLAALHAAYSAAKAAADDAAAKLKAVTDAIKLELTTAAPNQPRVHLVGPDGPALGLSYSESWRIDAKKLKAEAPETYVRYAKKSGAWRLAALKDDGSDD